MVIGINLAFHSRFLNYFIKLFDRKRLHQINTDRAELSASFASRLDRLTKIENSHQFSFYWNGVMLFSLFTVFFGLNKMLLYSVRINRIIYFGVLSLSGTSIVVGLTFLYYSHSSHHFWLCATLWPFYLIYVFLIGPIAYGAVSMFLNFGKKLINRKLGQDVLISPPILPPTDLQKTEVGPAASCSNIPPNPPQMFASADNVLPENEGKTKSTSPFSAVSSLDSIIFTR